MYGPIIWPMLKVVVKKATANVIDPACLIFPSINTKPTMPTTPIPYAMQANNEAPIPSKKYKVSIPVEQVKQDKARDIWLPISLLIACHIKMAGIADIPTNIQLTC